MTHIPISQYSFPTDIHFGPSVRLKLASFLRSNQIKRPLIVTDRGIRPLEFLQELVTGLENEDLTVAIFSEIAGNPVESQVSAGVTAFHDHDADCIIGMGGGAALDVAKVIALMSTHPGKLFDYEDGKPGARPIGLRSNPGSLNQSSSKDPSNAPEIPFWVALPTTSGTGSEVGRSSVISDEITHVKKVIYSPELLARAVFADPELTLKLPPSITAATGMDALTHCMEAYLAKGFHPICDGVALEGIRLIAQSLETAVKTPSDLQARSLMMMASLMGAVAFQKGLGLTHSCAHALSTVADLHHGLANGIMIDHALEFNVEAVPERFENMAITLRLKNPSGANLLKWLKELKRKIHIPASLSDVGVKKDQIDRLSELAFVDGCHQNNPSVCTLEEFKSIYQKAISC